jgi:TolB protein
MSRSSAIAAASVLVAVVGALALPPAAAPTAPGRNGLIAFVTWADGGAQGIAVIRPDGSGSRKLTRDRRDRSPAWSPDGRRLAFDRGGRIYVMAADGTGVRRLMPPSARGRQPAWSPGGSEIAFIRSGALFVVGADGTRQRLLYRRPGIIANRPSWSPDGKRIAFGVSSESESGRFDYGSIVVIRRAGGGARYVTDGRGEPADDAQPGTWVEDRGPDWSPDGARILFTRIVWLCPRCDQDEVFSAKPDGSDVAWITHGYAAGEPAWAPDGTRFAAVTANGLEIFSVEGERLGTLPRPGTAPAWQPLRIRR